MSYPPPQQNQPPYGQQPPPYQQPPYGQQPPPYQQPPYGYPPQYPYQPPRNNSGAIIAVLVLILVIAGGVIAFLLLNNQSGLCNSSDLAGTWYYNAGGLEDRLTIRGSTMTSVSNITGTVTSSFSCRGDTMIVTGDLGGTTATVEFQIVSVNSRELTISALGQSITYRRQ